MRALVLGPTGVVGDAIVREALEDARVTSILAVSRRALKLSGPKLETVLHGNFMHFEGFADRFASVDTVLCALGLSWYKARDEAHYRLITHDYVMACARVVAVSNASARICFVSGHGAAPNASQAWARIKAETEHDLEATFGSRLTVFRPGYIFPTHGREAPYWGDTVMRPFVPFRSVLRRWITDSAEVARAVLHCGTGGKVPSPATNPDIADAAASYLRARRAAAAHVSSTVAGRPS